LAGSTARATIRRTRSCCHDRLQGRLRGDRRSPSGAFGPAWHLPRLQRAALALSRTPRVKREFVQLFTWSSGHLQNLVIENLVIESSESFLPSRAISGLPVQSTCLVGLAPSVMSRRAADEHPMTRWRLDQFSRSPEHDQMNQ